MVCFLTIETESAEEPGHTRAESTHLNKAHPEGKPDPGSKQKEQKDIVPEKVADTFDQWGKLLHDR